MSGYIFSGQNQPDQGQITQENHDQQKQGQITRKVHVTKRCCEMEPYVFWIFRACQKHPEMECVGVTISGQITNCNKIETDNIFKGICVPPKYNCKTNTDCPILVVKDEDTGEDLSTKAYCNDNHICKYSLS